MFTQKLRSPYMESPAGASSAFFRPEYTQYTPQWEAAGSSGYDPQASYETENESALSKIYALGDERPVLVSPLGQETSTKGEIFTPEMKSHPRFDDLELQVLSSAPSELSSWSENEERPPLVKYDSESSIEHHHSIHFSPQNFASCTSRMPTFQGEAGLHHDALYAYSQGWKYFGHEHDASGSVDLSEMVEGVFPAAVNSPQQRKPELLHTNSETFSSLHSMPMGLRNALGASHRVFRSGEPAINSGSNIRSKSRVETETPPVENFMLSPWPVNDGMIKNSTGKGADQVSVLRVPLPCLSATERWRKHSEKHGMDPKLCGDMVCTHCDRTFDDVHKYTIHLDEEKIVHDNFCPDAACAFAALGYRYRWLLRRHICNHHLKDYNNKKLRKSACSPGGRSALMDNFLSHVYVCKKKNCSRAFYRSDSLSRHEKLIHSVGGKQKRKERLKLGKCDPKAFE